MQDVVIIGAGIVGLATAAALRHASAGTLGVAVADPALGPPPRDTGRALALTAGSRRLFERIGAWDAIARHAEPMRSIAISDAALANVLRPLLLGFSEDNLDGEAFAHVAPTHAVVAALREAARSAGAALDPRAVSAGVRSGASVRLHWQGGEETRARLLVAADGAGSPTRRAANIPVFRWDYRQHALVTTVRLAEPHGGRAVQHFLPGGPFALLPLPDGCASVVWSEASAEATRIAALPDTAFMAELAVRAGPELGAMQLAGPRGCFPLSGMIARTLAADRLALVGDAGRTLHPIAGQGVNLGLRDVSALTDGLIGAARLGQDIGAADVLSRYDRSRRFDSAMLLAVTDSLNRLFRLDGAIVRTVRDFGLGTVDRLPGLKRRIVAAAAGRSGSLVPVGRREG